MRVTSQGFAAVLLVVMVGCGSDDESPSTSASNGDPTTTIPTAPTGPRADDVYEESREACAKSTIPAVYSRYLAAIKRRGVAKAKVSPGLVAQAKRVPPRARRGLSAAPTAASLYAVSQARPDRNAAFRGCLRGLQDQATAKDG